MSDRTNPYNAPTIIGGAVIFVALILLALLWTPLVGPWSQERRGLANLREAQQSRQIQVEQARAEREAAIERAEAIRIIGEAAQKYPEYRQQEFIGAFAEAMKDGTINQIIYVPTEANIPLLEAGRRPE